MVLTNATAVNYVASYKNQSICTSPGRPIQIYVSSVGARRLALRSIKRSKRTQTREMLHSKQGSVFPFWNFQNWGLASDLDRSISQTWGRISQVEGEVAMRVGPTYWFSNSFALEYRERYSFRETGTVGILQTCWHRAWNLETKERLSLASGLL